MLRPTISAYSNPAEYIRDMILFRKKTEPGFSVFKLTKTLRRISPALVSLVVREKRKLTLDRVDEFSKLLDLNLTEKLFFRNWVGGMEGKNFLEAASVSQSRKVASTSILSDWINLYVKDLFLIPAIQKNPTLAEKQMLAIATPHRVQKAIRFLLREGHLRRTLDGRTLIETNLSVTDPGVPSRKIRQFHKAALGIAKLALDLYSTEERLANTVLLALDEKRHRELRLMVNEFAERLKDFASEDVPNAGRLYQIALNLSPVGGKVE